MNMVKELDVYQLLFYCQSGTNFKRKCFFRLEIRRHRIEKERKTVITTYERQLREANGLSVKVCKSP